MQYVTLSHPIIQAPGSSPHSRFVFYMAHCIEPVLPFGITLGMFLVPNLTDKLLSSPQPTSSQPEHGSS
jgi:hypothetical protein